MPDMESESRDGPHLSTNCQLSLRSETGHVAKANERSNSGKLKPFVFLVAIAKESKFHSRFNNLINEKSLSLLYN